MPQDLQVIADPRVLLLAWAAGLALAGSFVAASRIVGRGFIWLIAGTTVLVAIGGLVSLSPLPGWLGAAAAGGAVAVRGRTRQFLSLGIGGVGLLFAAGTSGGWLPSLTAAIALGGVMGEMLLGHWYLVDPRLPRWALKSLAVTGLVGLVGEGVLWAVTGYLPLGGATIALWVLVATSIILMSAVLGSLRYPAYSGVMAATGLSYLAVLTSLGAAFLGRSLAAGVGPFAS